jgi:hypothetical protein
LGVIWCVKGALWTRERGGDDDNEVVVWLFLKEEVFLKEDEVEAVGVFLKEVEEEGSGMKLF